MNIVLLHGLYMNALVMQPLKYRLEKMGYSTHVLNFSTVTIDTEHLFNSIDAALSSDQPNALVGHSLGGLIIQKYLAARHPSAEIISHVVTIGSPMQGAAIVRAIDEMGMSGILGDAKEFGLEPHDNHWHFPQKLGCIAGNMAWGVMPLLLGFDISSDGTVSVAETQIPGMTDHIETSNTHLTLLYSDEVAEQIHFFLANDKFEIKKAG
ncbi:alpha/beta fold hydrolase [Vibrio porteresiae]|uniref:Triacylglycerol lipase n=1 Tax=Vibrio porteresiae DSM 19223 TaxID=1123496 RepID=A0ABZ0QJX0_9VIBR|nr:alpha/beta fold hydrolase [Vibrio porteresiae]WPC76811.1 triacylglycerol lipase [Vibrio porteresiae DSM 19223]